MPTASECAAFMKYGISLLKTILHITIIPVYPLFYKTLTFPEPDSGKMKIRFPIFNGLREKPKMKGICSMFCMYCGIPNPDHAKFCSDCSVSLQR